MTVLDEIVERTRARLAHEPKPDRHAAEAVAHQRTAHAFRIAIRGAAGFSPLTGSGGLKPTAPQVRVIAEIKAASPSAGPIMPNPDVETIAAEYARGGAAAISVVTEPEYFHGSRDWLARARNASGLPVIMKDFIIEPSQLVRGIAAGADAILLLASLLTSRQLIDFVGLLDAYGCDAVVEVHDEEELGRALDARAPIIGVNNRDLRDFRVDLGTSERLGTLMPADVVRVAESGIRTRADVDRLRAAGFDAFLVGESLLRQNDRAAAVRSLVDG